MFIERINVKGYRALRDTSVEFQRLNVLVGANASGKSTILDLLSFLAGAVQGRLGEAIVERGGASRLRTLGSTAAIGVSFETSNVGPAGDSDLETIGHRPLAFSCEIGVGPSGYSIERESLFRPETEHEPLFELVRRTQGLAYTFDPTILQLAAPQWRFNTAELVTSQLPRLFRSVDLLTEAMRSVVVHAPLALGPASPIRLPQQLQPAAHSPVPDGSNLLSAIHHLKEADRDGWDWLNDVLHAALPTFDHLALPAVGGGQLSLAWYERGQSTPLYAPDLSAGTLRFLQLATLLVGSSPPPIILIDEPETSLNPRLIQHLASLLESASKVSQVIVATHAPALVRCLRPEHLMVVERGDAGVRVTRASSLGLDFEGWLQDYSLDQLWQMNVIGGDE